MSKKRINLVYKYLFMILLLSILSSCGKDKNQEIVLRVPIASRHNSFDCVQRTDTFTRMINRNIFETIIRYADNNTTPGIAYHWHPVGQNVFEIALYDNVRFSDGQLLTADDIISSLYRALYHPQTGYGTVLTIDSIRVESYNVLFIYSSNNTLMIPFLDFAPIMKASDIAKGDEYIARHAIGTGLYYADSKEDTLIVLKKNKYHRALHENLKAPDRIELMVEPSLAKQFALLKENEIDLLLNAPFDVYPDRIYYPDYNFLSTDGNDVYYMAFDIMRENPPGIKVFSNDPKLSKNPLKDNKVRLAIAHALDIETLIEKEYFGMAQSMAIPIPRNRFGYPSDKEYYPFDLALSKQLMKESGYSDGFEMKLRAVDGDISRVLAKFVKDSLEEINIYVLIELIPPHRLVEVHDRTHTPAYIIGYVEMSHSFVGAMTSIYAYGRPNMGRRNYFQNHIPRLIEIYDELSTYLEGYITHQDLIDESNDLIYSYATVLPLINPQDIIIYSKKFAFDYRFDFLFNEIRYIKR